MMKDDEECVRGVLNAWMRRQGFTVWLAADGEEALDLYRRQRETIDVVLLEVRVPGLDGPPDAGRTPGVKPADLLLFYERRSGPLHREGPARTGRRRRPSEAVSFGGRRPAALGAGEPCQVGPAPVVNVDQLPDVM
jgi:Response regulator receiver domain